MCGIVGIFSFEGRAPFQEIWPDLVNHLAHRGPDEGTWWSDGPFFFGHRRLSILDLEGGSQPMATEDGSLVVISNGEIYNYLELREELRKLGYVFRTNSDTEVLLHGYHAWGTELPDQLTGMYTFAIADPEKKELFLARDRLGEKPLFLLETPKYLAFSSELRSLAAFPDLSRNIDINSLGGFLTLNYVPGMGTLMKGIRRLAPASWILIGQKGKKEEIYWSPPDQVDNSQKQSMEEAVEEFRHYLDNSVSIALRSDVPVGIFLSGGMDSSLIAESAMRQGKLSKAYFGHFEEESYSEYYAAKKVADRLGLELEKIPITQEALKDFFKFVDHADDPLADSSALAVWTISQFAAKQNKVVLGGDGGDELFGGYLTHQATLIHDKLTSRFPFHLRKMIADLGSRIPTSEKKVSFSYKLRRYLRAVHLSPPQAHFTWNGTWLPEEAAEFVQPEAYRAIVRNQLPEYVSHLVKNNRISLLQTQLLDIADYLPNDILTKADRMSMAHGLEIRSPYLQHSLAEWALTRPDRLKVGHGKRLKILLRCAARRIFGKEIADRPKEGFSLPVHQWIRGALSEVVLDLLSPENLRKIEFLNIVKIQQVLKDHFSMRRSYGFEIWGLMVLVAWYQMRIAKPPDSPVGLPLIERKFPRHW